MKICKKCKSKFPSSMIIKGKKRNFCNRKYCLKCSPFKGHNTKILENPVKTKRICPKCETEKNIEEFYNRRGIKGSSVYCKKCSIEQTLIRQRKFKIKCIQYKGSKCEKCGYDKCPNALEFHHINDNKEFNISNCKLTKFDERITQELNKCILLCANCHREIHWETGTPTRTQT